MGELYGTKCLGFVGERLLTQFLLDVKSGNAREKSTADGRRWLYRGW